MHLLSIWLSSVHIIFIGNTGINYFTWKFYIHIKQWVYLVFKENILIATLLKRGNKNVDIKFSTHERYWNNLHQVAQNQKIGKSNNLIVLGAQNLWILMLCKSFFTPGRDIFFTIRHCRINTIHVHCRGNIKTVRNSFSEWVIVV
jgi:hypothetical protein